MPIDDNSLERVKSTRKNRFEKKWKKKIRQKKKKQRKKMLEKGEIKWEINRFQIKYLVRFFRNWSKSRHHRANLAPRIAKWQCQKTARTLVHSDASLDQHQSKCRSLDSTPTKPKWKSKTMTEQTFFFFFQKKSFFSCFWKKKMKEIRTICGWQKNMKKFGGDEKFKRKLF